MPIAGGILVAGSAARCLSSAAGMLRFLARLSGRRRHVRRSCGPGGGCCATKVQPGETTTPTTTAGSGSFAVTSEVVAGTTTTTTTTAMKSVHQNRRRDWQSPSQDRIQDPRWIEENCVPDNRVGSAEYERLFVMSEDRHHHHHHHQQHQERGQVGRQVRQLRHQERARTICGDSSAEDQQQRVHHPQSQEECSRLSADCCSPENSEQLQQPTKLEARENSPRLSLDDLQSSSAKLHRVEEIQDNQRLARRQRLHSRTSRCCASSTSTGTTTTTTTTTSLADESSRTDATRSEWETSSPDYVDLIVRGHRRVDEDRERGTTTTTTMHQRDPASSSSFSSCSSSRRRSRIPPYLATLLIISYTLFGIADACSSRSTPKPRPPTPTPRPNITFHMYTCPPDYAEWYCLNGATCFTVKIQESLLYNCLCANGFIGQRCEFKDLDGSYLPSRQRVMLETASIAGGATIAVFLVVIICIAAYIHCKRKQKEMRTSSTCVDTVDGPGRDPELRPFSNRSRSLMIFMAKNPNGSTICPSIEQTRMPGWNDYSQMESARMASVNEAKRGSSH